MPRKIFCCFKGPPPVGAGRNFPLNFIILFIIAAFAPSFALYKFFVFPWILLCWSPNSSMQVERMNIGDSPCVESVHIVHFLGGCDPWDFVLQGRFLLCECMLMYVFVLTHQ